MEPIFKEVFHMTTPSVRKFKNFLQEKSIDQVCFYYEQFYKIAFSRWSTLNKSCQNFLVCLIHHDWQKFLNYALKETILGRLRYPIRNGEYIFKVIHFLEKRDTERKGTDMQYTFGFLLHFDIRETSSIHSFRTRLYQNKIFLEDFLHLLGIAQIDDQYVYL